ncbi:hypothetical protein [Arthrobacter sp. NyZ413]|uniref:hypothetical protein n=1 Tax=Arthrobacter sp. NyZ413 TaxID=3144669 RepID=UPI003BF7D6B9
MALLTTRQKQQLLGRVLLFLLVGGFVGALWQGNPVAIAFLVVLVAVLALLIWRPLARKRAARKARNVAREQDRAAAQAAIEKIRRLQG